MKKKIRIGTRESQLAVWQADQVRVLLAEQGIDSELVLIKSDGDIDLVTPLYAIGVQGIFTRALDAALLNKRIDIAVHSMKDVPVQTAAGIAQAAVLKRASYKDLLVYKGDTAFINEALGFFEGSWQEGIFSSTLTVATSSIRRRAQWLHRYPHHTIDNLRGNVNTRLRKVEESGWNGAIFAAAGLERIGLRPEKSIDLDWMLPAPAQGAIMVVCKEEDSFSMDACNAFNDDATATCVKIERDFLQALLGGCSTPISGLAEWKEGSIVFKGNIASADGKELLDVTMERSSSQSENMGREAAAILLNKGGDTILNQIRNAD